MRFLLDWHGFADHAEGPEGLAQVLEQREGFAPPAAAWEWTVAVADKPS